MDTIVSIFDEIAAEVRPTVADSSSLLKFARFRCKRRPSCRVFLVDEDAKVWVLRVIESFQCASAAIHGVPHSLGNEACADGARTCLAGCGSTKAMTALDVGARQRRVETYPLVDHCQNFFVDTLPLASSCRPWIRRLGRLEQCSCPSIFSSGWVMVFIRVVIFSYFSESCVVSFCICVVITFNFS